MKFHGWIYYFGFVLLLFPLSLQAKIADPRPLQEGHYQYASHLHTVTALDTRSGKIKWETTIKMDDYRGKFDENMEADVQWNIINSLKISGKILKVTNSKGEVFLLNKKTGKQCSGKKNC